MFSNKGHNIFGSTVSTSQVWKATLGFEKMHLYKTNQVIEVVSYSPVIPPW